MMRSVEQWWQRVPQCVLQAAWQRPVCNSVKRAEGGGRAGRSGVVGVSNGEFAKEREREQVMRAPGVTMFHDGEKLWCKVVRGMQ